MNLSDTSIRWINSEPTSNTSQPSKGVAEGSVPFTTAFAEQFRTFSLRQPSAESGKSLPQPTLEADASRVVLDEPGLNDILMSSRLSETLKSTRALEGLNHQHAPVLTNKTIVPGALNPVSAPEMLKTSARPEALNVSSAPEVLNRSRASEMNQTFASTPSSTLRQKPHDGSDQKVTTSSVPATTAEINTSINEADLRQTALSSPAATIATVLTPQISAAPDTASPLAPTVSPATKAPETTAPIAPMAPVTTAQVTAAPEATSPLAPTAALTTTPVTKAPETTAPLAPMASVTTAQVTAATASPLAPTAALTRAPVTKAPETTAPLAPMAPVTTPQVTAPEAASPLAPIAAPTAALATTPVTKAPETTAPLAPMAPVTTAQVTAEAASPLAPTAALTTTPVTKAPETTAPIAPMAPVTTPQVTAAPATASPLAPTAALTTTPVTKAPETTAPLAPITTPGQIPATQAQRRFAYHAQNPVANTAEPITPKASDASLPRAEMVAPTQSLSPRIETTAPEIGPATSLSNAIKSPELSAISERAQLTTSTSTSTSIAANITKSGELNVVNQQSQPAATLASNTTQSAELNAVIERIEPTMKTSTPVQISSVAIDLAVAQWTKARMNSQSDSRAELPEIAAPSAPQDRMATEPLTLKTSRTETDTSALSQRFAEQLGQRLTREVTNTPWRAELELHPKSLGRIDIQLDFVNGQLEGHFQSNNALTRELLQEGLPKLRELLQQNGHTTVQLDVGSGSTNSNNDRGSPQANSNGTEPKIRITQGDESPDQQPMQTGTTEGFDLFV